MLCEYCFIAGRRCAYYYNIYVQYNSWDGVWAGFGFAVSEAEFVCVSLGFQYRLCCIITFHLHANEVGFIDGKIVSLVTVND